MKNETQSMIENPPNPHAEIIRRRQFHDYLPDGYPWYPPYTPDGSLPQLALKSGCCLAGEGMAEMGGGSWRTFGGCAADGAQRAFTTPSTTRAPRSPTGAISPWTATACWRSRRTGAPRPSAPRCKRHGTAASICPPGDEDGARAASIIHTMFDLERSGGNVLPELEAYLLLLLTGLANLQQPRGPRRT